MYAVFYNFLTICENQIHWSVHVQSDQNCAEILIRACWVEWRCQNGLNRSSSSSKEIKTCICSIRQLSDYQWKSVSLINSCPIRSKLCRNTHSSMLSRMAMSDWLISIILILKRNQTCIWSILQLSDYQWKSDSLISSCPKRPKLCRNTHSSMLSRMAMSEWLKSIIFILKRNQNLYMQYSTTVSLSVKIRFMYQFMSNQI